jgi:hypothetical protein
MKVFKTAKELYGNVNPLWGLGGIAVSIVTFIVIVTINVYKGIEKKVNYEIKVDTLSNRFDRKSRYDADFKFHLIIDINRVIDSLSYVIEDQKQIKQVLINQYEYMVNKAQTKTDIIKAEQIYKPLSNPVPVIKHEKIKK